MATNLTHHKSWEELSFSDNFIFCKVLEDKELCKQFLEKLLNIKIEKIDKPIVEKTDLTKIKQKSVRYDVYVKESNGTKVYDLEMQTGNYENLLLRARYYQSAMDIAETPVNTKYADIKETYIIFICTEDPFKLGSPSYTKKISFKEQPTFNYNDKTHLIIYNASAYSEEKNTEIKSILKFISNQQADTPFTNKLKTSVEQTKRIPDFGGLYMQFLDDIDELEFNAEARGKEEKALESAEKMLQDNVSKEKISLYTGLSLEKIEKMAKKVSVKA